MPILRSSLRNTIRVSNGLYPDQQEQGSVVPDLSKNCLQRLKSRQEDDGPDKE